MKLVKGMLELFFDNHIEVKPDEKNEQSYKDKVNFDVLVKKARRLSFEEAQMVLWEEIFRLKALYSISKPKTNINEMTPFVGLIEKRGWLFLFTDERHAREFAEEQGMLDENGKAGIIKWDMSTAIERINKYDKKGISEIRFNEGEYGWAASILDISVMYVYFKTTGSLKNYKFL